MNCRNCGHRPADHLESAGVCQWASETDEHRTECACPAYNVRPRIPRLTPNERERVLRADLHDLDRQIGALTQRRDHLVADLDRLRRDCA